MKELPDNVVPINRNLHKRQFQPEKPKNKGPAQIIPFPDERERRMRYDDQDRGSWDPDRNSADIRTWTGAPPTKYYEATDRFKKTEEGWNKWARGEDHDDEPEPDFGPPQDRGWPFD